MGNLTKKLNDVQEEALLIIRKIIKANNGAFVFSTLDNAYDQETDGLSEEFYKEALEFTADTQYDTNETVYLLSLIDRGMMLPLCKAVTQGGEEVTVNLLEADIYTVCEIADWIISNNLIEKGVSV